MIDKISCGFINSVYNFNDYTLNELICKLAQKMDEVITQSNESFNYLDWLKGQGLSDEVIKLMLEWKENGILGSLINDVLLQNIQNDIEAINSLLDTKTYYCNSISEMKNGNYKKGDMVITLGFYEINDGGGGQYIVKEGDADGYFSHSLRDNLIADLIYFNNKVNIKQIGARPKIDENNYDIKPYVYAYLSYLDKNNGLKL